LYKIPATTVFLGKNLIFMPECHSTSDHLLALCQAQGPAEGTLVITAHQTAGRGQRGNSWEAQSGKNLTFSFLLKPTFLPVSQQFFLTIIVSLGIRDFLTKETGTKVHIKWPNDILMDDLKICGVLIENQILGQTLSGSVIGVGLNVNQQFFSVPTATSLALVTGQTFDLSASLNKLLSCIEQRYLQLREGRMRQLRDQYLDALYLRDQPHRFAVAQEEFVGTIRGIDEIGRLLIETPPGPRSFDIKEIRYAGVPES
jgi:birA, biotin-[acetyl-CoA-carboxylase] ligase region